MKKYLIAAASVAALVALSAQAQALSLRIGGGIQIGSDIKIAPQIGIDASPAEVLGGVLGF